jgi:hypothetical protein
VGGSGVDDILLTWQEALRAYEETADGVERNELIEQVRRLESLYRRRADSAPLTAEQRETGESLVEETTRLLGSGRDTTRADEPGEWY